MAADRSVIVRLGADTSRYQAQMRAAAGATGEVADGAERAGESTSKMGGMAAKAAGAIGAAFAGLAIADFLKESIDAASDLNETVSKAGTIFGDNFGQIESWSETAAEAMGLSKSAALDAAAGFGNMFQQLGIAGDESAAMSQQVVQMAADFGSFNNLPTADVIDKISGAFRGEYDSLQAIIPNINAARVEQEAMTATGKTSAAQLTASDKAMAVLAITTKDGAIQLGDFARTADGVANSQKTLQANFEETQAAIGQALLPVVKSLMDLFSTVGIPAMELFGSALGFLVEAITNVPGPVIAMVAAFAGVLVVGQIVGFLKGLAFILPVIISGMGGLAGAATLAGRAISLMGGPWVVAIGAVAAALAYFATNTDEAAEATAAADERWQRIVGTLDGVTGAVTSATRAMLAQEAQNTGMLGTLQDLGVSTEAYINASAGVAGGAEALAASVANAADGLLAQSGAYQAVAADAAAAGISQAEWIAALEAGDPSSLQPAIDAYAESVARSTGNASDATRIQALFAGAITETETPLSTLGGALNVAGGDAGKFGDATDAAAQRALALGEGGDKAAAGVEAAGGAAAEATTPMESLKKATDELGAAAAYADTMTQFLTASMDAQAGNAISQEQATRLQAAAYREIWDSGRAYSEALDGVTKASIGVTEAQAKVDEVTKNLGKSQENGGTTADDLTLAQLALADANRTNDEATNKVADATDRQFDANVKAGAAALASASSAFVLAGGNANLEAATAAATASVEESRAAFIAAQPEADRLSGKANATANALFGIPGAVATKISQAGADGVIGTADDVTQAVQGIPDSKNVNITSNAWQVIGDVGNLQTSIQNLQGKTVVIEQVVRGTNLVAWTGGKVSDIRGYAAGGRIPGTPPADPRKDNVLGMAGSSPIMLRSREYILNESASDYYGDNYLNALNAKMIPKMDGYANGGSLANGGNGGGSQSWDQSRTIHIENLNTQETSGGLQADLLWIGGRI